MRNWVVVLSVVGVPLTLTHAFEDFSHGIPARFGLALLPAVFLLSIAYAAQVAAAWAAVSFNVLRAEARRQASREL
jgi:hypothetical protein